MHLSEAVPWKLVWSHADVMLQQSPKLLPASTLTLQCWLPLLQDPEKMKARRDRFGPTPGQAKAEVRTQKLSSMRGNNL